MGLDRLDRDVEFRGNFPGFPTQDQLLEDLGLTSCELTEEVGIQPISWRAIVHPEIKVHRRIEAATELSHDLRRCVSMVLSERDKRSAACPVLKPSE